MAEQSLEQFAPGECAKRGYYLEDLCFNAQQAAEKAIKALLIQRDAGFPYVHDIAALLTVLERAGQEVPHSIQTGRKAHAIRSFHAIPRYRITYSPWGIHRSRAYSRGSRPVGREPTSQLRRAQTAIMNRQ